MNRREFLERLGWLAAVPVAAKSVFVFGNGVWHPRLPRIIHSDGVTITLDRPLEHGRYSDGNVWIVGPECYVKAIEMSPRLVDVLAPLPEVQAGGYEIQVMLP